MPTDWHEKRSVVVAAPTGAERRLSLRLGFVSSLTLLLAMGLICTTGCGGCTGTQTAQQDEAKKKKEREEKKKKPPVEIGPLLPILSEDVGDEQTDGPLHLVKPGHWASTVQEMKANYEDFVGSSSTQLIGSNGQPVPLLHTPFAIESTRPVALPKGRLKRVEGLLFVPEQTTSITGRATLRQGGSGPATPRDTALVNMPSHQYFIIVVAKEPARYTFLKVTDAIRAPWEEESEETADSHYRVVLADSRKGLPLSSNVLTWSTIAYLVWDEVDPTRLSAEQQAALVDWLHWGGRLIINGPDSLDTLRGSFLDPFLPADGAGQRTIVADDLRGWNDYWAARQQGKSVRPLKPTKPWSGVRLQPREGASQLRGAGDLLVERSVGSGSIVVSGFQLNERDLINWPGFDGFLNAALLRRTRRAFAEGPYDGLRVDWKDYPEHRLDAHFTTGLRLFARDSATPANSRRVESTTNNQFGGQNSEVHTEVDRPGGVAAWSEFSPVAAAARESLQEAAGVTVPGQGFVVACLALYLVVLVPLNWMVFYSIGRVEWAWVSAPIIAVLGTLVVVRQAQLDIGFVRSHNEIALLELQKDYPRGLLSRFTAFYTSLSTTYDVEYEHQTTLALPFPVGKEAPSEAKSNALFEKQQQTHLRGLSILSNTTKMVHSEEILPLSGSLRLGTSSRSHQQIENGTGLDLKDVAVVRRRFLSDGTPLYEGCWIGDLSASNSVVLGFQPVDLAADRLPFAAERKRATSNEADRRLDIDPVLKLAFRFPSSEDPLRAHQEEYRLVGRIEEVLPGETASPAASQIQGSTVVLAHLQYGDLPIPRPDANSRGDVLKPEPERKRLEIGAVEVSDE